MLPSTRVSDFAELVPAASLAAPVARQRAAWRAVWSLTAGRLGVSLTTAIATIALLAPWLATSDPFALVAAPLTPPTAAHLMGTDAIGRDLFSGVMHGARASLYVAASVAVIAFVCGALVGMTAGWKGGLVDDLLMRGTEMLQVVPRFFLVVIVVALFGPGIDRIILTLGLTSWPVLARVMRGEVLAMRESEFIIAARAGGARARRTLWRDLLPNVMPSAMVLLGLLFGQVIRLEASVGFLGLGDPNALTWGLLAGQAQGFFRVAWWVAVFPGLAIAVTVLGVSLLADAWAEVHGRVGVRRPGEQAGPPGPQQPDRRAS